MNNHLAVAANTKILALLVTSALALAASAATSPAQDTARSAELTDEAAKLIQAGQIAEALDLLETAIEADEGYWEAYYQRGRAYGIQERYLEARDALVRASHLNPGHPSTHRLAWEAAYKIGDYENAWDQAIRASLAGVDMNQRFLEMFQLSDPPDDFELRINAPKVFVAAVDISEIEARSQLPFNRNPATGGIGTISGRPAYAEGVNRVNENAFDLERLRRSLAEAVFRAPYLGAVVDLELADYVLGVSVDALSEAQPVRMEGYLRLYDSASGDAVYYRQIFLRDISSEVYVFGELQRYVNEMQQQLMQRD
jgi:hypothetical protein